MLQNYSQVQRKMQSVFKIGYGLLVATFRDFGRLKNFEKKCFSCLFVSSNRVSAILALVF